MRRIDPVQLIWRDVFKKKHNAEVTYNAGGGKLKAILLKWYWMDATLCSYIWFEVRVIEVADFISLFFFLI